MRFANKYGSITKHSGNRRKPYSVRITVGTADNGEPIRKYLGFFKTRAEAIKELAIYNDELYDVEARKVTVRTIYNLWSKRKYATASDSTITGYSAASAYLEPIFDTPIRELKSIHLEKVINACHKGPATKKKLTILIKQLFAYAMECDIISKDYSDYLKVTFEETTPTRPIFTEEEIRALEECTIPGADLILISIFTGLRPGELLTLTKSDINLEEGYIEVTQSKTKAGLRVIPISPRIEPIIKAKYENSFLYIAEMDGKPINYDHYYRVIFNSVIDALALNKQHRPHDTRHTFATMLSNADANPESIKKLCGHKNYSTTSKHYTHKSIDELKKAINRL